MTDGPGPNLDGRLRDAFAPDPAAVTRVSAGVDARSRRGSSRATAAWLARVAAMGVAGAVVVAALMLLAEPRRRPPAAEPVPATVSLSGSFIDGLLVVSLPDGSLAITGGEARTDRPKDGYGLVLVEGEFR